ncbi:MAG: YHS domain-containing protein [Gemmatimonadaceae bacterium]|nr:YHS domain-containing protein [Gemmatimonadaceae bacterium]
MSQLDHFAARIEKTLSGVAEERHVEQRARAAEMQSVDDARQQFAPLADAIHHLEIRPRLDTLISHFPNAHVDHWLSSAGLNSHCTFSSTERHPASVKLTLGITHDPALHRAALRYTLEIIPQLIDFEHVDELVIDISSPDMEEVVGWTERKLESFLKTYLRLETDSNYQRENQHVDPVCGMHVQAGRVFHRAEYSHHTYHFCSQDCQERFSASPEFFVGGGRIPLPSAEVTQGTPTGHP